MQIHVYMSISFLIGCIMGWLISKIKFNSLIQLEKITAQKTNNEILLNFETFKATSCSQIDALNNRVETLHKEKESLNDIIKLKENEIISLNSQLATTRANNESFKEKLETQKKDIEDSLKRNNIEFENIANKILETKTEKFTELNKQNLNNILEPLGKNIEEFKKQVDLVYNIESKERFSLGERVKELAQLNNVISEEAKNLTNALKGEPKTQGCWGEMVLESILEKSGLTKGIHYKMEFQLLDETGNAIKSETNGKKMRPDAIVTFPDNRNVIIDSKVSLNAYTRYSEAKEIDEQEKEKSSHIVAIKDHIKTLSNKGYDAYEHSLDFVIMFIPSESAYITALKGDVNLWKFAYDKNILLLSPMNLITSLKLIKELWYRELQNRNVKEIADRGAKLYEKFVDFVNNLNEVGKFIDKAKDSYDTAYKQLSTGKSNLISQATKLKGLGVNTKKELIKNRNINTDVDDQQN